MCDAALVVGKDKIEHHQVDLLHLAVEGGGVGRGEHVFGADHRCQHLGVGRSQHQQLVALGPEAGMVADDGAASGVADLERLLAHAAGGGLVLDADRLVHHVEGHALAAVEVMGGVLRVDGFDIQILHVAIGIGDTEGHMLGTAHQNAGHAGQGGADGLHVR